MTLDGLNLGQMTIHVKAQEFEALACVERPGQVVRIDDSREV